MSETCAFTNSLCSQNWMAVKEILVSFQWRKYTKKLVDFSKFHSFMAENPDVLTSS